MPLTNISIAPEVRNTAIPTRNATRYGMSCVARGASDTTFYILAVYFGSVGITKTRNAVTCGLIADFAGIIAAIIISYLFFF